MVWRRVYGVAIAWLAAVATTPSVRALIRAAHHAFAFVVGARFDDDVVAYSKPRLVVNDAYRDRLLAPEIAALVDLCDALALSIPQRKAFFRCFLHLDYLRRAGVSRSELLRYCSLRDAPVARFLLPSDRAFAVAASAHRAVVFRTQRWDVNQLLALMFSLCTMETNALIDLCVQEITATDDNDAWGDRVAHVIDASLVFSYGVPSPTTASLATFLARVYRSETVDFARAHSVDSVGGVISLFPVLLFPCVWLQRVLQKRVLGPATWRKLAVRRAELALEPGGIFSADEIVAAATSRVPSKKAFSTLAVEPDGINTPRKVLPVADPLASLPPPQAAWDAYQNEDDAWRATADSVLATVFVWCHYETEGASMEEAPALFQETRTRIAARSLSSTNTAMIERHLVREYGYAFMMMIFAKSSVADTSGSLVSTIGVKKQVRRATVRHRKANDGIALVEDKASYWKEYTDPARKRVFYHNVRTGESRWEKPSTLRIQRRKKGKRSPTRSPSFL